MLVLVLNSILLGAGLAMDAFSVSMADGLYEREMKGSRMMLIAGTFAVFQTLMPLIGYILVRTAVGFITGFQKYVPYIALLLLLFLGVRMLVKGIRGAAGEEYRPITAAILLTQGLATSIDALSVGFPISEHEVYEAVISALIIGLVTLVICRIGLYIGMKAGMKLENKANILGGIVLIAIGIEIFLKSIL